MTQDEIIELGKQAGIKGFEYYELASKKEKEATTIFVNLVAAKEREACAQIADKHTKASFMGAVGAAIRARGEQA